MLKLSQMRKEKNIATCTFYPENGSAFGTLAVDVDTKELLEVSMPAETFAPMYLAKARAKLCELCSTGQPLPETAYAIWF